MHPPPPHIHLQARLSPANQGAPFACAPVFSSCNKIHTVCSSLRRPVKDKTWTGLEEGPGAAWPWARKRHNTLCHSCYYTLRPVTMETEPKTPLPHFPPFGLKRNVRAHCIALAYSAATWLLDYSLVSMFHKHKQALKYLIWMSYSRFIVFMFYDFVFLCKMNFLLWENKELNCLVFQFPPLKQPILLWSENQL